MADSNDGYDTPSPFGGSIGSPGQWEPIVDEASKYFNRKTSLTFERLIGSGIYGSALRIKETEPESGQVRRLVVKRALGSTAEMKERYEGVLRNEIRWLKIVRGASHIVRMVFDRDRAEGELPGPMLILEFIPYGNIEKFIANIRDLEETVPNRVLWAFFLCLVRACIGMAYPLGLGPDAAFQMEDIPPDKEPSDICHEDMHKGNVLIDHIALGEHGKIPMLKLIDFGSCRGTPPGPDGSEPATGYNNFAVRRNLFQAAKIIKSLIVEAGLEWDSGGDGARGDETVPYSPKKPSTGEKRRRDSDEPTEPDKKLKLDDETIEGKPLAEPKAADGDDVAMEDSSEDSEEVVMEDDGTNYSEEVPDEELPDKIRTHGGELLPDDPMEPPPFDHLDEELRELLLRCLAQEPKYRPGLEKLKTTLENAVRTKVAESYVGKPNAARETDEAIATFVHSNILSATTKIEAEENRMRPFDLSSSGRGT